MRAIHCIELSFSLISFICLLASILIDDWFNHSNDVTTKTYDNFRYFLITSVTASFLLTVFSLVNIWLDVYHWLLLSSTVTNSTLLSSNIIIFQYVFKYSSKSFKWSYYLYLLATIMSLPLFIKHIATYVCDRKKVSPSTVETQPTYIAKDSIS